MGHLARMLPAISADSCLYADLEIDPARDGCQSFEATDFLVHDRLVDSRSLLIHWQIGMICDATFQASGYANEKMAVPVNPELLKAQLTLQIYKIIKQRGMTQAQAGEILGIKQPHVSALMRNRAGNFSVGRLIEFLTALGQDVQITVKPMRKEQGEMSVVVR
jgi:predicted XRE-type DNA-binding protein